MSPDRPPRRTPAQGGLWGRQKTLPATTAAGSARPRSRRRDAVNDLDLVTSVVSSAQDPGYVVIGVSERVFLRDASRRGFVVTVPRYEADTVAQLLDTGHLRLGGTHLVSDGHQEGPARSVLVPAATRTLLARWTALHRPRHRLDGTDTPDSTGGGDTGGGDTGGGAGPAGRRVLWRSVRAGGDTKTRKSRRTLALPRRCVTALDAHRTRQAAVRALAGGRWTHHDLVFASETGTSLDAANVRRGFRRVATAAGLDAARWTPRELRHSFVSLLSDDGVPLEQISRLVGHSGTTVTEQVYRKQIRPVVDDGATAMDRIFGHSMA